MAFLDRWIGRPNASPELASAMADLDRLGVDRPELAEAARGLGTLLVAAFDESNPSLETGSSPDERLACWASGRPIFQAHPPRLDRATLMNRLRRLLAAMGEDHEPARVFARATRAKRFNLLGWVAEILAGRPESVTGDSERLGIDPALACSTLRLMLLASVARISVEFDRSRPEGVWERGDCPHCGSRPLLAESRGLEQRIYYRCGLCAAGWPGERLRCPSCGETDSKALHHSFVEGEGERCRLAHCDGCLYDWKVVSTLTALSPPAMIVADLATVHLDLLAADRREGPC